MCDRRASWTPIVAAAAATRSAPGHARHSAGAAASACSTRPCASSSQGGVLGQLPLPQPAARQVIIRVRDASRRGIRREPGENLDDVTPHHCALARTSPGSRSDRPAAGNGRPCPVSNSKLGSASRCPVSITVTAPATSTSRTDVPSKATTRWARPAKRISSPAASTGIPRPVTPPASRPQSPPPDRTPHPRGAAPASPAPAGKCPDPLGVGRRGEREREELGGHRRSSGIG